MVGDPLEVKWECSAEEDVIMGIDSDLILIQAEMKEWVRGSRIVIKGWHHNLLWEMERDDLS